MILHVGERRVPLHVQGADAIKTVVDSPVIIRPRTVDVYAGAYDVAPGLEPQVLPSSNKWVKDDVRISAFPYSPFGLDLEKVKDLMDSVYRLDETDYATWDPSTTAKVIVASRNLEAYTADMAQYEYYLHWQCRADIMYQPGTSMKAVPVCEIVDLWQALTRRPSSFANIAAEAYNNNACITFFTAALLDYYNTSGSHTFTWSASYGFYPGATAATFSSSTSDTPNVTLKTPTLSARCNSSYFAVARGADVDQEESTIRLRGELLRVKAGSSPTRSMYGNVVKLYNGGES